MFDVKCDSCVVINKIEGAFRRREGKGELLIPKGMSYNDAMMINEQGIEILDAVNNRRTVYDIIQKMCLIYPEVDKSTIEKDVYKFLFEAEKMKFVKVKGVEEMYKGHIVKNSNEYGVYRCYEGDLKTIFSVLNNNDTVLDIIDYNTPAVLYNSVNVRAKVFMYSEDYYLLKKNDEIRGILSIVNGNGYLNKTAFIGKINLLKVEGKPVLKEFIVSCLDNYKDEVAKESKKIRFSFEYNDTEEFKKILEILSELPFEKVAKLKDELHVGKDVFIFDYLYQ